MANFPAGFPLARVNVWMDENGRPTRDFLYLIQTLWQRTGGASGNFQATVTSAPIPVLFESDAGDFEPMIIPGNAGGLGPQGATGAAGPAIFLDAPDAEEPISLPGATGPQGQQGPQGAPGPALIIDVPEPDEPMMRGGLASPGGWFDEKGSGGTYGFAAGTDFTAGTTTTLTLSQPYGSQANLIVAFDGAWQGADQFSLSGKTLTFTSAIPSGTQKVYVKGFLMPQ